MHPGLILRLTILLALANGAPLVAAKLLGTRLACPLDAGVRFPDGHPLLGASKTVRGVLASMVASLVGALLIGIPPSVGIIVGAGAMAGDCLSSFVKRRLDLSPSSRATGLDQIPESLLPLVACWPIVALTAWDMVAMLAIFFVGEIVLSRALYRLHLRDRPY